MEVSSLLRRMKDFALIVFSAALGILAITGAANRVTAQQLAAAPATLGIEVVKLQPDFYMLAGAGGNIAMHVGTDGVVLVDTGSEDAADRVLAVIRTLTDRPIRYIINTSADADHVGGNLQISAAGQPIHQAGALMAATAFVPRSPILAEERVLTRMSAPTGAQPPFPVGAWPTTTYSAQAAETQRNIFINGQGIQVFHQPSAHSDGDSIVHFRRSDVLVLGDIMDMTAFPVIDAARGGSIQGVIDTLNRAVLMAIPPLPMVWQSGGTLIIPGHGRVCVTEDIVFYRDMVTIVRDRVQALVAKGMTLAQIQEANPAAGYTRRYGASSGRSTTARFVEAIYMTLSSAQKRVAE
jgi:cyclase